MTRTPWRSKLVPVLILAGFAAGSAPLSGCSDAQAGSLLGAGLGALAGQAIGHDTEATLIGTAVGAGAGYIIGNESDKGKLAGPRWYESPPPPPDPYDYDGYDGYH